MRNVPDIIGSGAFAVVQQFLFFGMLHGMQTAQKAGANGRNPIERINGNIAGRALRQTRYSARRCEMTDQAIAISPNKTGDIMEAVIARGDLAQLNPQERAKYYTRVCESIGLNPLTKPFEYITLNGKLTLYARKDAADQLRKIYGVSIIEMTESREEGLVVVTVKARDASGRTDMAKGAVSLKGLQGEALANAFMKCETKAKRRVTLSICGLGFLDETEVETISNAHTPRLPKKDARDIYSRLQAEVDEAADIKDWLLKNEGRLQVLPEDWENILRLRIQERQQTPMPAEEALWTETEDSTPPEWSSAWDALGPVKQAGILCSDESFWKFFTEKEFPCVSASDAAKIVRALCHINSRSELANNSASAGVWRRLVEDYRAWQREPLVVDTDLLASPEADTNDDIPTAAEYFAQWNAIILGATNADQLAKTWSNQIEERKRISWTEQHDWRALQARVRKAVESMREMT